MKSYIGLGSNCPEARERLFQALDLLQKDARITHLRQSAFYETPAMLPKDAPPDWNRTFINGVCEFEWGGQGPEELLALLADIEKDCGRIPSEKWAPRSLDLDILLYNNLQVSIDELVIPHEGLTERSFVLDPLAELCPSMVIPGTDLTVLEARRRLKQKSPAFMEILNLTPDSFSDKSRFSEDREALRKQVQRALEANVQYLDLGAESTRPQASEVSADEEWSRLYPALELLSEMRKGYALFPKISIDSYKPKVIAKALDFGVDVVNDVNAGRDPEVLELVQSHGCEYVCMHSLAVPASRQHLWPIHECPTELFKVWALERLEEFDKRGIELDRIILDPGIGFGKIGTHSLKMLQTLELIMDLPARILIGHSRKSFMDVFTEHPNSERNAESIGISMGLGLKGVEILRVHDAHLHQRAWIACQHLHRQFVDVSTLPE